MVVDNDGGDGELGVSVMKAIVVELVGAGDSTCVVNDVEDSDCK